MAPPQSGSSTTDSRWNLEMLVLMEGGKPENPEKNPRSKDENQQQTQPTYDTGTGNRTWATLVGGERSHHCAILAPRQWRIKFRQWSKFLRKVFFSRELFLRIVKKSRRSQKFESGKNLYHTVCQHVRRFWLF